MTGLLNPLIDLLLGCIGLLIRDDGPGIPVSNLSELAAALAQNDGIPARAEIPAPSPARKVTRAAHVASRVALALVALSLITPTCSAAQAATPEPCGQVKRANAATVEPGPFREAPDNVLKYLPALHPEIPVPAARQIAVIETNTPGYRALADEDARQKKLDRLSFLLTLEDLRANHFDNAARIGWLEFVAAKAPELSQARIDSIADSWWRRMEGNPFRDIDGVVHDPAWEEARDRFRVLRTGTAEEADAARIWLQRSTLPTITLAVPEEARDTSPLSVLLARDISEETRMFRGGERDKLRKAVECLIAGKSGLPAPSPARRISVPDVDALFARLYAGDAKEAAHFRCLLEEWLKKALESDLRRPPKDSPRPEAESLQKEHGGEKHEQW